MRIYLAARYARHPEMRKYAEILEQSGHTITSQWIHGDHKVQKGLTGGDLQRVVNARLADEDTLNIIASDYLLCFNDEDESIPVEQPSFGGRHAEFGIAVACWYLRRGSTGIGVGIIGEQTHIFNWLPFVEVYSTFYAWLEHHRSL